MYIYVFSNKILNVFKKCLFENGLYTKYLYSKYNIYPYIALQYIPLQVTAFHKFEVRAFRQIACVSSVQCERFHDGDVGHEPLVIQSWFHQMLRVTACLLAYLCIYQHFSKN